MSDELRYGVITIDDDTAWRVTPKGAFFALLEAELDAANAYHDRMEYEYWYGISWNEGVIRQFRAVCGVIGFAAAMGDDRWRS